MKTKIALSVNRQAGFSLLETLVAFTVLVLVLGVAFQVFANGARAQKLASEYAQATTLARSFLTLSQHGGLQYQGETEDGYHWQIERVPYEPPELAGKLSSKSFYAEKITITVAWESASQHRQLQLDTIQLLSNEN